MKRLPFKIKIIYYQIAIVAAFLATLFFPCFHMVQIGNVNSYKVYLNGEFVGKVQSKGDADAALIKARKNISSNTTEMVYAKSDITYEESTASFGTISGQKKLAKSMTTVLTAAIQDTMEDAYSVKIDDYLINLSSIEDVEALLEAALDKYDTTESYGVELTQDTSCRLNVLTPSVYNIEEEQEEQKEEEETIYDAGSLPEAGIFASFTEMAESALEEQENANKDFDDFQLGLVNMGFDDDIQIVETYLPQEDIEDLQTAIADVTQEQETEQIYEVQSGDTLSEIAEDNGMSVDDLISMNELLENENSTIRVGDELTISVPEPKLSVTREEESYYEEDYDADVQYVDNDDWYTDQTEVIQQPSSGHRKVVAMVSYDNDSVVATDIIKEEVTIEAVPKIIERGTKTPPTFIRPVSGGTISSGFGAREAPKAGASTYHEGIDFAVPVGTAVMASSGGVVTRAGWASGYGLVVYIQHENGVETRYGHLSKLLVSVGETVTQGEKIALSGNTGNSTGAHLHFEIRINGTAVNPLKYLS